MEVGTIAVHADTGNGNDVVEYFIEYVGSSTVVLGVEHCSQPASKGTNFMKVALSWLPTWPAPLTFLTVDKGRDIDRSGKPFLRADDVKSVDQVNGHLHRSVVVMREIHLTHYYSWSKAMDARPQQLLRPGTP